MKERCPYWYEAMQRVALALGWEKRQARELLDAAAAFEPSYYHFYRQYANVLLPEWYGEDGETQAFAEEVSKHLGDPDGPIVYFEVVSLLAGQCQTSERYPHGNQRNQTVPSRRRLWTCLAKRSALRVCEGMVCNSKSGSWLGGVV